MSFKLYIFDCTTINTFGDFVLFTHDQDYVLFDILNHESAIEKMNSYTIIYNMPPWERSRNTNFKVFCL